jgi:hypothetical protein
MKGGKVHGHIVCPEPRAEFYQYMDAANIDLKAFTERFYHKFPELLEHKPEHEKHYYPNKYDFHIDTFTYEKYSIFDTARYAVGEGYTSLAFSRNFLPFIQDYKRTITKKVTFLKKLL